MKSNLPKEFEEVLSERFSGQQFRHLRRNLRREIRKAMKVNEDFGVKEVHQVIEDYFTLLY